MELDRAELERRLELAVEELLNAHHAFNLNSFASSGMI